MTEKKDGIGMLSACMGGTGLLGVASLALGSVLFGAAYIGTIVAPTLVGKFSPVLFIPFLNAVYRMQEDIEDENVFGVVMAAIALGGQVIGAPFCLAGGICTPISFGGAFLNEAE